MKDTNTRGASQALTWECRRRPHLARRVVVCSVLVATILGCDRSRSSSKVELEMWIQLLRADSSGHVVAAIEVGGGADPASVPECARTGLYLLGDGSATALHVGEQRLCDVLTVAAADRVAFSSRDSTIIYADQLDGGAIKSYDLRTRDSRVLIADCLPPTNAPVLSPDESSIAFATLPRCSDESPRMLSVATREGDAWRFRELPHSSGRPSDAVAFDWIAGAESLLVQRGGITDSARIFLVRRRDGEESFLWPGSMPTSAPQGGRVAFLRSSVRFEGPWSLLIAEHLGDSPALILKSDALRRGLGGLDAEVPRSLLWSHDGRSLWVALASDVIRIDSVGEVRSRLSLPNLLHFHKPAGPTTRTPKGS